MINIEPLGKKKFGVFIRALYAETNETQYAFVSDFFKKFGIKLVASEPSEYIKNWMSGKNQSYERLFRGATCNQENCKNALVYLEKTINIRFKNVQSKLLPYSNEYQHIDFKTDDCGVFFTSVITQFMEIVGLPLPPTQEKESLDETPSEQMRRTFERAVAEANIARHIHDLADHLENGLLCPQEVSSFLDTLPMKIASGFVDLQNEEIFLKMKEFITEVRSYFGLLSMLPSKLEFAKPEPIIPAWQQPIVYEYETEVDLETEIETEIAVERYSQHWREYRSYNGIFSLIKSDRDILNNKAEIDNHPPEIEDKLNQLHLISSIFSAHRRICELFEEITEGKTLLVF